MNYLIWKGIDSRWIEGLIISELPPITKPQMRARETVVDGVDGSIIEELGYEPYNRPVTIGLTRNANIDKVIEFFSGKGEAVFSNEPDKFYKASIIGQIDYARLVRFRTATVVFRVQPFKHKYRENNSALWLNEYGGKNLFNHNNPTLTNGTQATYEDGLLTITSTGTSVRYARIYNFDADKGDIIRVSSILMDNNCRIAVQEYDETFEFVYELFLKYSDGDTASTIEMIKLRENTKTRLVMYTDFVTPTGDRVARYKNTIVTVNNSDIAFEEYEAETSVTNYSVSNMGNYTAEPIVEIKGKGTVEVAVNGNKLFNYTFPDGEDAVVIDSQKQDAYWGEVLKNRNMLGGFPTLARGMNEITWNGNVLKLKISSRSRWL